MTQPESVQVRMYNVGFGDCFLISFKYADTIADRQERHMLIDFGSKKRSLGGLAMVDIAEQISRDCRGHLDVVVVTHRHQDHLSGFADSAGTVMDKLQPAIVVRSWTEDPKLEADARKPHSGAAAAAAVRNGDIGAASMVYLGHLLKERTTSLISLWSSTTQASLANGLVLPER